MALTNPVPKAPWGAYVPHTGMLTAEQFAQLPEIDGWMFELYEGRLLQMPGPGDDHAVIQMQVGHLITTFLSEHSLAKLRGTGCFYFAQQDGDNVLCPDLYYITPERVPFIKKRGSYLDIVPDWVIEIASPSDYRPQVQQKMQVYLLAGVRMGWVIWPSSQTVEVWQQGTISAPVRSATVADTLDGGDIVPGFTLPVARIFGL